MCPPVIEEGCAVADQFAAVPPHACVTMLPLAIAAVYESGSHELVPVIPSARSLQVVASAAEELIVAETSRRTPLMWDDMVDLQLGIVRFLLAGHASATGDEGQPPLLLHGAHGL